MTAAAAAAFHQQLNAVMMQSGQTGKPGLSDLHGNRSKVKAQPAPPRTGT